MGGTYEMLWDCQFCGQKKLLGKTHKHCPHCGGAQNAEWRYFPSDAEKVAVENHVFDGADKICSACQAPNGAKSVHCSQCGAPLDDAKSAPLRASQTGTSFAGETEADAKAERVAESSADAKLKAQLERDAATRPPFTGKVKKEFHWNWPATFFLGFIFCLFGYIALDTLWTESQTARVIGHSWQRNIEIQSFGPIQDSAWCDEKPSDARNVRREREVRSHKKVPDGESCHTTRSDNGDGTFSESESCTPKYRSEPIYDSRCYYTVDRWHLDRMAVAKGASQANVAWPPVQLRKQGQCLGCEREGPRSEKYTVLLALPEKESTECDVAEARWSSLGLGIDALIEVGKLSGKVQCDTIRLPGEEPPPITAEAADEAEPTTQATAGH